MALCYIFSSKCSQSTKPFPLLPILHPTTTKQGTHGEVSLKHLPLNKNNCHKRGLLVLNLWLLEVQKASVTDLHLKALKIITIQMTYQAIAPHLPGVRQPVWERSCGKNLEQLWAASQGPAASHLLLTHHVTFRDNTHAFSWF